MNISDGYGVQLSIFDTKLKRTIIFGASIVRVPFSVVAGLVMSSFSIKLSSFAAKHP